MRTKQTVAALEAGWPQQDQTTWQQDIVVTVPSDVLRGGTGVLVVERSHLPACTWVWSLRSPECSPSQAS